ncbi:MAG: hypothetical protein ACRD2T_07000, partial [Thermoanaerobaculia bacterium]
VRIPPPYPEPGPDPCPGCLADCGSYGGGSPLPDPSARLRIVSAGAAGVSSHPTDIGSIGVAAATSRAIGGFSGSIRLPEGMVTSVLFTDAPMEGEIRSKTWTEATMVGSLLRFALVSDWRSGGIPLEDRDGLDWRRVTIAVRLRDGVQRGDYPLVLEEGELIDWESSRAIEPVLAGASFKVGDRIEADPTWYSPGLGKAIFRVGSGVAAPGQSVAIPFYIWADQPTQGYGLSLDFDENLLDATRIEEIWRKPDDRDMGFVVYRFNNTDPRYGDLGAVIAAVSYGSLVGENGTTGSGAVLPNRVPVEMLRIHFTLRPDASYSSTPIRFVDGMRISTKPVASPEEAMMPLQNAIVMEGSSVYPETMNSLIANSFVFVEGRINIVGDVAVFLRGDSDGNFALDISDPVHLLSFLFLGGAAPACLDAADADDSGILDLSDALYVLGFLFLDGAPVPSPLGKAGVDPTPDLLSCGSRF